MNKNNIFRKAGVAGIVLIFIISIFISTVESQYINISTRRYIGNELNTEREVNILNGPRADIWNVTLEFNEPGGAYDNVILGEKTDASDGQDSYDTPKSPAGIPPIIRAWFASNFLDPYDELWKEYKHSPDDYKIWHLTIQWIPSDYSSPTDITISWNSSYLNNSYYNNIFLKNNVTGEIINMFRGELHV